ncbi:Hypothetical protein GbCGDNIH9_5060a [Granulibacter bethesdensis]|uniref:Uncharacterized protein n=1 Tax=Granulibacter bethesdensis TaxID=364410 RepID=A0AAC9KDG9_9PROT|nr:hypothetical protein [Granulibacter bethesdensis]APH55057.1 Hypothetical protein GbCGDNIH9_5060a [Granulibacter bethesdensis]APH62643.1 Hypothetical protein GbCGDNIH8_5060a [Granulibacter bethesdensis]
MYNQLIIQSYQNSIYLLSITEMCPSAILPEIEDYEKISGGSTWKNRVIGFIEACCNTGIAEIDTGREISAQEAIDNLKNTVRKIENGAPWYGYQLYSTAYGKELIKTFNIDEVNAPLSWSFLEWAKLHLLK